eukprot:COSAG06_NODE_1099_length_10711_cov_145.571711_9_plen_32_part_00
MIIYEKEWNEGPFQRSKQIIIYLYVIIIIYI